MNEPNWKFVDRAVEAIVLIFVILLTLEMI